MLSLNQILAIFQALAADMRMVSEFRTGEVSDLLNDKAPAFPLLFCVIGDSTLNGNLLDTPFSFYFLDLMDEDRSNEQEIYSDQQLNALDFVTLLKDPDYHDYFEVTSVGTLTRINGGMVETVRGYLVNVTLQQFYCMDRCAVPLISIPGAGEETVDLCPVTDLTAEVQSSTSVLISWVNSTCVPAVSDLAAEVQSDSEILLTWTND